MNKKLILCVVMMAVVSAVQADNVFSENTPSGGPYKFESDLNWSSRSLMDSGNWFVVGAAMIDEASGSLTADPQGEKGGFFFSKQGKAGTLNITGGELKILSNVFLSHNGGKGTLNLSGGTLFVEGNLSKSGKSVSVSGGKLSAGNVLNCQVDTFDYTGGTIDCAHFGISSGVFTFEVGPKTSAIVVNKALFGGGVLTLAVAEGFVPPADQEIVLFTFAAPADKMSWTDGSGKRWADGEIMKFGENKYTVVFGENSLAVIPK